MICEECQEAAEYYRNAIDKGLMSIRGMHPTGCSCPCQHRTGTWEKMFSVEQPNEENS